MRRRRSAPWHRPLTRARGTQREVVVFPPSGPSPRAGACSRGMIGASPWYSVEFTLRRSPPVRRAISTSRWTGARPRSPRPRRKMLKPQWGSGLKNCHTSCVSPCLNRQSPVRNPRLGSFHFVAVTKRRQFRAPARVQTGGELRHKGRGLLRTTRHDDSCGPSSRVRRGQTRFGDSARVGIRRPRNPREIRPEVPRSQVEGRRRVSWWGFRLHARIAGDAHSDHGGTGHPSH